MQSYKRPDVWLNIAHATYLVKGYQPGLHETHLIMGYQSGWAATDLVFQIYYICKTHIIVEKYAIKENNYIKMNCKIPNGIDK